MESRSFTTAGALKGAEPRVGTQAEIYCNELEAAAHRFRAAIERLDIVLARAGNQGGRAEPAAPTPKPVPNGTIGAIGEHTSNIGGMLEIIHSQLETLETII